MENLNLDTIRLSRDLLQRFVSSSSKKNESEVVKREEEEEEEEEELDVELTLGLSLGGRFGVDKSCKLTRSSSTAACLPIVRDNDDVIVQPTTGKHSLVRSSSLPVESEVEWRKRKELQTLRRMEAKKRRSEKQRISMADKGVPKGKSSHVHRPPLSQVSIQSHRGRSSSISELDFKALQGSSSGSDFSPVVSIQTLEEGRNKNTNKNVDSCAGKEDMPSVFTRGDGPNGTRVDGILYKYGKGEEVRIMCVCHGILFSPEEFVKHAGGSDVTHPLKHIVVNPVSSMMVLK